MRLAVYVDLVYRREGRATFTDEPVVLVLAALRHLVDEAVLVGWLDPVPGRWQYMLPPGIRFVPCLTTRASPPHDASCPVPHGTASGCRRVVGSLEA